MLQRALTALLIALSFGCVSRDGATSAGMPIIWQSGGDSTMLLLGVGLVRAKSSRDQSSEISSESLGLSMESTPSDTGFRMGLHKVRRVSVPVGADYIDAKTKEAIREAMEKDAEGAAGAD